MLMINTVSTKNYNRNFITYDVKLQANNKMILDYISILYLYLTDINLKEAYVKMRVQNMGWMVSRQ